MTPEQISLYRLDRLDIKDLPWLRHKQRGLYCKFTASCSFENEFGSSFHWPGIYDEYDAGEFEILSSDFHHLWEGAMFSIAKTTGLPNEYLLAKRDDGFRFRIHVVNYGVRIPFLFKTKDSRSPVATGCFRYRSGQLIQAMTRGQPMLSITFEKDKPELKIDHMINWKTVISE